jgi:DNA-directed RNA polymerase specialized sigma24 family protein
VLLDLYDAHAPRLFAVALRITGDRHAAAAVLEEAFVAFSGSDTTSDDAFATLLRLTRERAMTREARSPLPPVHEEEPTPRRLVDDVWMHGKSVADLAAAYRMPESQIREMLRDGMVALRRQFGTVGT